jgi:predicted RNA binding protein YcfA (HicA-like mRNA interferase family)
MTKKLPVLTGDELVRILERLGFLARRQKGSHLHLYRIADGKRVTVPIHKGRDIPNGTLRSILRDADISPEDLRDLV